jgi:hypothetical protein
MEDAIAPGTCDLPPDYEAALATGYNEEALLQ